MRIFGIIAFLVASPLTFLFVNAQRCKEINSCKCEMDDGSGIINLRSLAHPGNLPKWTLSGGDGWMYKYNPCLGYALGGHSDLAVGQASTAGAAYDLGVQSYASFNVTEDGLIAIIYQAKDQKRSSRIMLKCDRETRFDRLEFYGEIRITEYDFLLTSPCACPGYCDNFGLHKEIAMNMSGYWENEYGGPGKRNGVPQKRQAPEKYPWSDVGTTFTALLFHDVVLIVLVAACLVIFRQLKACRRHHSREYACRYAHKDSDESIESGSQRASICDGSSQRNLIKKEDV